MRHALARVVRRTVAAVAVVAVATGCGRTGARDAPDTAGAAAGAGDPRAADTAPAVAPSAAASPAAADPSATPLTVADVDRWSTGMRAESTAVAAAAAQLARAKTAGDTVSAMAATNETATRAAGARAAGVDDERYQRIRTEFSAVTGYLTPIGQEMDLSQLPPAMVTEMTQEREKSLASAAGKLPADVVAALRPRASALRTQEKQLVAARLRAAGMRG